ncbi:MAG: ABC transporter permease [Bacteroidetes bacterium]|nr:ABC transporter permease [Bacteroidota bacterium]
MFRNYLKIALRSLQKQKMYSVIKIGGFALSIAACLLIALFIRDELSYDSQWPDGDRIYRVIHEYDNNGKVGMSAHFQAPFANTLKAEFPEVERAGRFMPSALFYGAGNNLVMKAPDGESIYEDGFTYADQQILDMLQVPMVYGKREHALDEINSIVISKRKSDKYFPNENPIGKIFYLNNDKTRAFKISGVIENFPNNSHLRFDFLLTLKGIELWNGEQQNWLATNYFTYVQLRPGTNVKQFESKLESINKKYIYGAFAGYKPEERKRIVDGYKYHMQPLRDIHLRSGDMRDAFQYGDIRFVWLFAGVASFILLIACVNFINLSTAKSANRAKEVGLRKVVGSHRLDLVKQFLIESTIFSVFSFILGLLIAWAMLPYFNTLSAKSLTIPWSSWWFVPLLISSASVVGILAGTYPSFYLSAFNPINVLKGQLSKGSKNARLRSVLVVFQFTTSVILIISTIIIYQQMQFILNRKVGFDKDQVVLIQGTNTLGKEVKNFRDELKKLSQVKDASVSDYLPVDGFKKNDNNFWNEGKINAETPANGQYWIVDENYINTMGMHIVEGRNFSSEIRSDTLGVIVNQTMAKNLNLGINPIGKRITNGDPAMHVIGVVEDFNFESMRGNIRGLCMTFGISPDIISVKVTTADVGSVIPAINSVWRKFSPNQPIRYTFFDESFASMYKDVQRMGWVFTSFAVLAIIIACLGLFALSAFMAEQRSKEVGIRKVLGASVTQVTSLLSKDFIRLVLVSIIIASPIAWWAMHTWLQDFAYRTPIGVWIFFGAGIFVVMIALTTISFQAIKAAVANPVKSLRAE